MVLHCKTHEKKVFKVSKIVSRHERISVLNSKSSIVLGAGSKKVL